MSGVGFQLMLFNKVFLDLEIFFSIVFVTSYATFLVKHSLIKHLACYQIFLHNFKMINASITMVWVSYVSYINYAEILGIDIDDRIT